MSLSDDILSRCFSDTSAGTRSKDGTLPGEVLRQQRGRVVLPEHRIRARVDPGPAPQRDLHLARAPGISRAQRGWRIICGVPDDNGHLKTRYLGEGYQSWLRARVALKLYYHWLSIGHSHHEIPTTLSKQNCEYGNRRNEHA
jgi:hypothetical protein